MATYFVTASWKGNAKEEYEIAGVCVGNTFYTKTLVYDWIKEGHEFYSHRPPAPDVLVECFLHNGDKCIRTKADTTKLNNLLNLPDC